MSQPIELARQRTTRELERSKAALAASLRDLEDRVRETISPSHALQAHLGWFLAGAFVLGVGLAMGRRERSWR